MINNESLLSLKAFLEEQITIHRKNQSKHQDWKYISFSELILDCGVAMVAKTLPSKIKQGNPKQCYFNCQNLVFKRKDLIYVEGYALAFDIDFPIPHAWLMTAQGDAVEPTWNQPGSVYIGVPLSTQWLKSFLKARKKISNVDNISIFEGNYLEKYSLLKQGLPSEAIAEDLN